MQSDLEGNHGKLSHRQWGYILLFNGFVYIMVDVLLMGWVIISGQGSTLPWPYWVGLILMMPAGIGSYYYGALRLNRARRTQKSRED